MSEEAGAVARVGKDEAREKYSTEGGRPEPQAGH